MTLRTILHLAMAILGLAALLAGVRGRFGTDVALIVAGVVLLAGYLVDVNGGDE